MYVDQGGNALESDRPGVMAEPLLIVPEEVVECPSLVFVYLEDDSTDTYSYVKMLSHFFAGVQSQCVVSAKYSGQKSPAQ